MLVYRVIGNRALLLGTTTARPVAGASELLVMRTPAGGVDLRHIAAMVNSLENFFEAETESYKLIWVSDPANQSLPVLHVREGQSPRYLPNWTPE